MVVVSCTLAPIPQCGGSREGCHMRKIGKRGAGAFEMVACAVQSNPSRILGKPRLSPRFCVFLRFWV